MSVYIPFKNRHPLFIGIYKLTSPSGKVYIGQSWDIIHRWNQYRLQNGIENQRKLLHSLQKYGFEAHQRAILAWFSAGCTQTDLDRHEELWMDHYRDSGIELLNLKGAGSRGRPSAESIQKGVRTRRANGSYVLTEDHKAKLSARLRGRKQAASVVAKRAANQKGQRRPHLIAFNALRVRTDEEKQKQSEARKKWWAINRGKPRRKARPYTRTPESCRKYSEIKKAWWAKRRANESAE